MHVGTVFQAKRRPNTVPKPPSTPVSIQERFREPPDFDFQAMLGPFWPHVGPMLGPRAPKSSPRGAEAWSLDGPGAAQERPRAPKTPQGAPRRPPEADFGPKIKPTWAHVGSVFGSTKDSTSGKLRSGQKGTKDGNTREHTAREDGTGGAQTREHMTRENEPSEARTREAETTASKRREAGTRGDKTMKAKTRARHAIRRHWR